METLNNFCPSRCSQVCPCFHFLQNANLYRKYVHIFSSLYIFPLLTRKSRQTFCTDLRFEENANLERKSRLTEIVEGFQLWPFFRREHAVLVLWYVAGHLQLARGGHGLGTETCQLSKKKELVNFSPVFWIRILKIFARVRIRMRIKNNADPKHCFSLWVKFEF